MIRRFGPVDGLPSSDDSSFLFNDIIQMWQIVKNIKPEFTSHHISDDASALQHCHKLELLLNKVNGTKETESQGH